MGQAPSGSSYNDVGNGWPLIAGAGDFDDTHPAPKKYTTVASKLSIPGDIILGIRASIGAKVVSDGEYCLGRGVAALRPSEYIDARFLWQWLTYNTPALAAKGRGATFKQVNREDIGEMPIQLPPMDEQLRIAQVLDCVDALRTKRREAIALLDDLAQSIFFDMFGDPRTNPMGWPVRKLSNIGDVQGGLQLSGKRNQLPIEIPYLRVANVYRNRLVLDEVKELRATPAEIERTSLKAGDLLIVEGHGNPEEIGRVAIWDGSVSPCTHQNHLIRFRVDYGEAVPKFIAYYANSPGGRRHLLNAARTTSGLNTISTSAVKEMPVALPPLALQEKFAKLISAVDWVKIKHIEHLAELDALFSSVQSRAFRGELWAGTSAA